MIKFSLMNCNTKKFHFNHDRHNFEQQPKRKISTPTDNGMNIIGPISGTTTPKHMFGKFSCSSTSSVTSSTLSVINGNEPGQHMTVNPFEETNRFRLEQSVLSPNLFHVANTSTPERDTNSLWNIDQRAILYPADIQTDESSLMAQYVYDFKMSKQVIPAVEAFWNQNKIIIESPLTCTTGSAFKQKFSGSSHKVKQGKANSVNSPLSNPLMNNFNSNKKTASTSSTNSQGMNVGSEVKPISSIIKSKRESKNQLCQTMLSIPIDTDLTKILELKNFFITGESESACSPKKDLNNSIRKKLFDQNSEDLSSSTATTTTTTPAGHNMSNGASILRSKIKSGNFSSAQKSQERLSQLPKPQVYSNLMDNQAKKETKMRNLASSSSSTTNEDCWKDSFDFEDHQFASSPKFEKFSNIIHDIGDFGHDDDLHDSVFEQQHRTPPDLSPLLPDVEAIKNTMTPIKECKTPPNQDSTSKDALNINKQHHNRFFHFDMNSGHRATDTANQNKDQITEPISRSAVKKEKNLNSPNLSPIRQQEVSNSTLHGSQSGSLKNSNKKRLVHSSNKETLVKSTNDEDMNASSSSLFAKSIIFMDIEQENLAIRPNNELQNLSFSEEIVGYDHHTHYKREEFYKRVSLGDDQYEIGNMIKLAELDKQGKIDSIANNTSNNFSLSIQNEGSKNQRHVLESTKSDSESNFKQLQRSQLEYSGANIDNDSPKKARNTTKKNFQLLKNSNSNHTSISNYSIISKPNLTSMIETTTNTFNQDSQDTGYQTNSGICGNGSTSSNSAQSSSNPSIMIMDTTQNNNNLTNSDILTNCIFNNKKSIDLTPMNVDAYCDEKENNSNSILENICSKKTDLNSLKNNLKAFISSLPKQTFSLDMKSNVKSKNNKSLYNQSNIKSLKNKKNSISLNSLENIIQIEPSSENFKINFSPHSHFKPIKTGSTYPDNTMRCKNSSVLQKHNIYKDTKVCKLYKSNSEIIQNNKQGFNLVNNDEFMSCDSMSMSTSILNNSKTIELNDNEKLIKKKHELDSLYMDQSILMNRLAPSEYARNVISKAKNDLNLLENLLRTDRSSNNLSKINSITVNKSYEDKNNLNKL